MQNVHVGRGTTRGALTVFPVWGEDDVDRDYGTALGGAEVIEKDDPDVSTLVVANNAQGALLLVRGQLLEGGWQNRMVVRSVIVAPNERLDIDVVCVEQGRWDGRREHVESRRRATTRVQAGLRAEIDQQSEVWRRVSDYDAVYGSNPTSSFAEHTDRAAEDIAPLTRDLRPFPGQIGVVIAVGGHPVSAELFDSPVTLAEQYQSIVAAAAMDAAGRPAEVTPSRRARRFIDRASNIHLAGRATAGASVTLVGESEDASISLLQWRGRDVHTSLMNPRHELVSST